MGRERCTLQSRLDEYNENIIRDTFDILPLHPLGNDTTVVLLLENIRVLIPEWLTLDNLYRHLSRIIVACW